MGGLSPRLEDIKDQLALVNERPFSSLDERNMKKQKKIFYLDIDIPIYQRHLVLFIGASVEQMVIVGTKKGIRSETLSKKWISDVKEMVEDRTCAGFCASYGENNTDVLLWVREKPCTVKTYETVYHELYHAVDKIAEQVDPTIRLTDQYGMSEARAYLFGYLITEINKVLWNMKK